MDLPVNKDGEEPGDDSGRDPILNIQIDCGERERTATKENREVLMTSHELQGRLPSRPKRALENERSFDSQNNIQNSHASGAEKHHFQYNSQTSTSAAGRAGGDGRSALASSPSKSKQVVSSHKSRASASTNVQTENNGNCRQSAAANGSGGKRRMERTENQRRATDQQLSAELELMGSDFEGMIEAPGAGNKKHRNTGLIGGGQKSL